MRQQLKWPVLAVVLFGAVYGGSTVYPSLVGDGSILFGVSLAGIPISVAIAVLRYRLYAIDHIISRTVSWAVITAILVGVFVAGVLGLQAALAGIMQQAPTIAVAASTLAACALFQPIRGRVQRAVDRRFDRARYDSQRTVDAFANRLRSNVDLMSLEASLESTAADAVRPTSAWVWLRSRGASPGSSRP